MNYAPGRQRQRRRRIESSVHRAMCCSVSDGSGRVLGHYLKASWYGWTKFQRTLRSRWPKLPDCYDCRRKNVLNWGSKFLHLPPRQRPQSWDNIEDPVVPLEGTDMVTHQSAFFGKGNYKKCCVHGMGKVPTLNVFTYTKSSDYSYRFRWVVVEVSGWEEAEHGFYVDNSKERNRP